MNSVRMNAFTISGILIIAVTVFGAYAQGRLTNRWNHADVMLARAAKALEQTPEQFGKWHRRSDVPIQDEVSAILGFAGAMNRVYENVENGQTVSMAIIVGPPGPTSTHVAELCYSSAGFKPTAAEAEDVVIDIADKQSHFRRSVFSDEHVRQQLEVLYSWRQAELWSAPAFPRTAFGGGTYLYKLQVASYRKVGNESDSTNGTSDFLKALLPALDASVFRALQEQ